MSDMNINTNICNKHNELVAVNSSEEAVSESIWVIGVSKTHPGLKYYFNTITGVSLWNISREDMERAKQTMRSHQNNSLYINCPEPKEPPPNKRTSINKPIQSYCKLISQESNNCNKQYLNSGLARESPGFSDVCYGSVNSSPNVITVNFRSCPHPTCHSPIDNPCGTHSQIQSTPIVIDTSTSEKSHKKKDIHNLLGSKRILNQSIAETKIYDSSTEHLEKQINSDIEFSNHNTNHRETLDLTPLKIFAKNDVIKDKWYIIADADVYLQHIKLLKSVINSDNQCCLMVPQNVKIELEDATRTEHRTKAYGASYFIYKMYDLGRALIDENLLQYIQDKSNEEHILESCSKLQEQRLYVIVISNDIELQKYRNKIYIPIFTVAELKEYLYKSNNSDTTKFPESSFNLSHSSRHVKVSTPKLSTSNNLYNNLPASIIKNQDITVKQNKNIGTSYVFNDVGTQVEGLCDASKTADAEVQTNFYPIQIEERGIVHENTNRPNRNHDNKKELSMSSTQLYEPSIHDSKRIKLRRRRMFTQTASNFSTKLGDNKNHIENAVSNTRESNSIFPCNDNLLHTKQLEERNKKIYINEDPRANEITTANTLNQKIEESCPIQNAILKLNQDTIRQSKLRKDYMENKNVMFEVTTDIMDENLRTRSDEWVSRFVQIMEETLTQVLRKHSSLHLPPPLNMYEATISIDKKFHNDEDVADASNKFLNVLNRICDKKGNINANINPSEYMEMYSFGVYMIDALQGLFSTCEDLQTAAESLSKLLNDIQHPEPDMTNESLHGSQEEHIFDNTDSNDNVEVLMIVETESLSNEKFEDTEYDQNVTEAAPSKNVLTNDNIDKFKTFSPFEITFTNTEFSNNCYNNEVCPSKNETFSSTNIECTDKSLEDDNNICTETQNVRNTMIETSPNRYNVRFKRNRIQKEKESSETTDREALSQDNKVIKRAFLSNLLLQHNIPEGNAHSGDDGFSKDITEDNSENVKSSVCLETSVGCSNQFNKCKSNSSHEIETSNEPKIFRNFVVCSEFEDRLKTRRTRLDVESEELGYEEDLMEADYLDEDMSSGGTGRLEIDEYPDPEGNVDEYQYMEQEITKSAEYIKIDFKYFVRWIAEEIKKLSSQIYTFSRNSCEALNAMSASEEKKSKREKAEKAYFCIENICTALTKILNRDKNGGYNVQALLKHTEFDDISVDEDQLEAYGKFIARCLEHAHDLKNIIEDVLSDV